MVYLEKFTLNQIINITSKMIFPIENKNLNGFYVIAVAALLFANVFLNQIYLYKTMFNKLEPECFNETLFHNYNNFIVQFLY